jgi:hypothetical protein
MNGQENTRSAELSLQLHRAALPYLWKDWDRASKIIRANLEKQRRLVHSPMALAWISEWEKAVDSGPDAIEVIVAQRGERGDDLRQMTPLAGVLPNSERWRVIGEVRHAAQGS